MKKKVVVYGLGQCWDDHWKQIDKMYEILCCVDQNPEKENNTKGFGFDIPENINCYGYDILLICNYRLELGVREELVVKWNISADKIYYFSENDYLNDEIRPDSSVYCKPDGYHLTVVIPTYNRKERLKRTLDILEKQTNKNFDILILDNASDYNIEELLENREKDFSEKLILKRNISNIGQCGNLACSFLYVKEGWLWTLSDDDMPSIYAVEIILQEIKKYPTVGALFFSHATCEILKNEKRIEIFSLNDLAAFYKRVFPNSLAGGDFIFFSNKVYNLAYAQMFMEKIFTYSYTGISYLMPILFMLEMKKASLVINGSKKIVWYNAPNGDHWDRLKMALGTSTISDLPLSFSNEEEKKIIYRLCMLKWELTLEEGKNNISNRKVEIFDKLYDVIYKLYLDDNEKKRYLDIVARYKDKI